MVDETRQRGTRGTTNVMNNEVYIVISHVRYRGNKSTAEV